MGADPINRIDPSGRIFFEVTGAALSALGLYVALGMSNPVGWGLLAAGAAMELYALYDEHNSGYDNLSKAQRKQDIVDDRNRRVKDALDELDRIDNGKPPRDSTGADGTQNTDNQGGCGDSN